MRAVNDAVKNAIYVMVDLVPRRLLQRRGFRTDLRPRQSNQEPGAER